MSARAGMVGDGDGDDGDSSSIDETLNLFTPRSARLERLASASLARRRRAGLAEVLVVGVGEGWGVLAVHCVALVRLCVCALVRWQGSGAALTQAVGLVPETRGRAQRSSRPDSWPLGANRREKRPLRYRCGSSRCNFKHPSRTQACPSVLTAASSVVTPDFANDAPTGGVTACSRRRRCPDAAKEEALKSSTQAGDYNSAGTDIGKRDCHHRSSAIQQRSHVVQRRTPSQRNRGAKPPAACRH